MSGPPQPPQMVPQMGGMRKSMLEEIQETAGSFILVGLILVSVYVSRIPKSVLATFRSTLGQALGLAGVLFVTSTYGWIHGILAALAYALVVSRAVHRGGAIEGFDDIDDLDDLPAGMLSNSTETTVIPNDHKWFVEKVLGENPSLIRDKEVETSAVQDLSGRGMGSSSSSSSSFSR